MSKIKQFEEQAKRAERLARAVLDGVTSERLMAFAAECRQQIQASAERGSEAA